MATPSPSSVHPQSSFTPRKPSRTQRRADSTAQKASYISPQALLRLPKVLAIYPVGRSTWWKGIAEGRYPRPVKLGPRSVAWRASEILALVEGTGGDA